MLAQTKGHMIITSLFKRVKRSPPLRKSSTRYNFPSVWKAMGFERQI